MDDRQPVSLARRALSYLICYLVAVQPMLPAVAAQITPVTPGTKMDAAGNGVPVVNITTPNGAGISHNQYQQYNVGKEGLILNNATGQLTQTQLGGLIQNNPNLKAGHEAQAIINEVVGANRSQLQGYTEVAGKAANVMVANPYGITCNGCGFINTPNVTLTTGKPQLDANGNLAALDVTKGSVIVEGQGLDGSSADAVSIVARATEINAGIHAKDLSVTVGANRVGTDGSVTPIAGEGAAPSVAVDTGALGGMYANRIHLVSSEKGVGVNLGNLVAKQGDIQLDASGKLTLNNSLSSGALTANAESVTLGGENKASGQVTLSAQQDATLNKSMLVSDAGVSVTAKGNLTTNGTSITAGRDIQLSGATVVTDSNAVAKAGNDIRLQAQDRLSNSGQLTAGKSLNITAKQLDNHGMLAGNTTGITTSSLQNGKGAAISGAESLSLSSDSLLNQGVLSAPVLSLSSVQTDNSGLIQGSKALTYIGNRLNNLAGGTLSSDNSFALNLPQLFNSGLITSKAGLTLSGDALTNSGEINAASLFASNAQLNNQQGGLLLADNNLSLDNAALTNDGQIAAATTTVDASTLNNSGTLQGKQSLQASGKAITSSGTLLSDGKLTIAADTLTNRGLLQGQQLAVAAGSWHNSGNALSAGDGVLNAATLDNSGKILGQQNLQLKADSVDNSGWLLAQALRLKGDLVNSGLIQGSDALTVTGDKLSNKTGGQLLSAGTLTAQAGSLDNQGSIQADTLDMRLQSWQNAGSAQATTQFLGTLSGALNNSGTLLSQNDFALISNDITNSGKLAANRLSITAPQLTNAGLLQGNSSLSLNSTDITNAASGQLISGGSLTLSPIQLTNAGLLQVADDFNINGRDLTNSGRITATNLNADLSGTLNNSGSIAAQQLNVSGDVLKNQSLLQGDNGLNADFRQFSNLGAGQLLSNGLLSLKGTTADNAGVWQGNSIDYQFGSLTNNGTVYGIDALKGQSDGLLDNRGSLTAGGNANLTAGNLQNSGKMLADSLVLRGNSLSNSGLWQGTSSLDAQSRGALTQAAGGKTLTGGELLLNATELNTAGTIQGDNAQISAGRWQNKGSLLGTTYVSADVAGELRNSGEILSQGTAQVSAQNLNNSGSLLADKAMTLSGGALNNSGSVQGQTLAITPASVTNQGSLIGLQSLTIGPAQTRGFRMLAVQSQPARELINNAGGQLLTQGALNIAGDVITNNGSWQGQQILLNATRLANNGAMQSAGDLTLNLSDALTSATGSKITANGNAALNALSLTNQGQWIAGNLTLKGTTLSNGGEISGVNGLTAVLGGTLTQQQNGALLSGGKLDVQAATASNDGRIQGGDLTITTGTLTNNGRLQGDNSLLLTIRGRITNNNSGTLISQSGLTLTTPELYNYGLIQGTTNRITASSSATNSGKMLSAGELTLTTPQLVNSGWLQAAQLTLNAANASNIGTLLADQQGTLTGSQLLNQGTAQGGTLAVNYDQLNNSGTLLGVNQLNVKASQVTQQAAGKLFSGGNLLLESTGFDQLGQVVALGDATLKLINSFTARNTLAAANRLTISSNGAIENLGTLQGQALTLSAGGDLTNNGQITTGTGESSLSGNRINMNSAGTLQGGGNITLASRSDVALNGFTGTRGSLTISSPGSIVNTALLYAGQNLYLYANSIQNQRGDMLAGNSLWMQRDAAGNANGEVINTSGTIESQNGDITIRTGNLLNQRDGLRVEEKTQPVSGLPTGIGSSSLTYRLDQLKISDLGYYIISVRTGGSFGKGNGSIDDYSYLAPNAQGAIQRYLTETTTLNAQADGNAGRIAAGRNLDVSASQLNNLASTLLAGNSISLQGNTLNNQSWFNGVSNTYLTYTYDGRTGYNKLKSGRDLDYFSPDAQLASFRGNTSAALVTYLLTTTPETETIFSGDALRSVIQAGGNVNASFSGDISNTSSTPNAGWVGTTIHAPALNNLAAVSQVNAQQRQQLAATSSVAINSPEWRDQLQNALQQVNGGTALDSSAPVSASLANQPGTQKGQANLGNAGSLATGATVVPATLKNYASSNVDTSAYPLPTSGTGYFVASDNNSPYLITINPKLNGLGQLDASLFGDLNQLLGKQPGSAPQESRQQYTDVNTFLGSSYLLDRLNLKPDNDYRFLGDAAFDTRYVSNTVLNQTGSRFLNGVGSDLDQMRYLMDNAAASQQSLGLQFGVSLTADQVASLDKSIIWWEATSVNGQTVMVPKVYLSEKDAAMNNGSVIAGNNVILSGGNMTNSASSIVAQNAVSADSQNNIDNLKAGLIKAGGDLNLSALNSINNVSSTISGKKVALESVNGDINNTTASSQWTIGGNGPVQASKTLLGQTAAITSLDALSLKSGNDINLTGSSLNAGGDLLLNAWHDLSLNSIETSESRKTGNKETHSSGAERTTVSSGGNLTLKAGQDITSQAAALAAEGDIGLQAGRDINLNAVESRSGDSERGSKKTVINETVRQQGTEITSGGNISLAAGRDITSKASDLTADHDLALKAGRDVNISTATESDYAYREETKTKKGFLKKTTTHTIQEDSSTNEKASHLSGNNVSVTAGNNLTIQGSSIAGDKGVALNAGNDLNLVTATNTASTYSLKEVKKSGLMGSGGLGISYGKQSAKSEYDGAKVTESDARSLVGAGNGAVTMTAGNNVLIKGSDVVAGGQNGDISVKAKNIAIVSGQDQVRETAKQESKSSGFGLSLNLGPLDTVRNLRDIMNNTSSVYDQVKQVGNEFGASALDSPAPGLTYGRSASQGSQNIESVYQSGSALNASGNLTLKALGDADTSTGNILVEGSSLNAGGKAALDASRNIDITSAADSQKAASSNSSKSWSATTSASIGALARSGGGSPNNGSAGTNYGSKNSQMSGDSSILTQHTSSITAGSVDVTSHTGDIGITGSTLTGTTGVALNAEQGNVSVVAGEDRQQTSASGSDHAIGDLGGDGYSGTVGVGHNSWKNASTGTQQSTLRSGIVSTLGDVTVNAAKDVNLQGADVFAGDSLSVNGENIYLDPAKDTHNASSSSESTKYGITGSVSGYAVSIAQAVDKAREANRNHDDPRLQAIYAAQAAMTALSSSAQSNAAIKVSVSATAGSSHQSQTQSSTQENGTVLGALNNVDLNAEKDITAQGVKITGNNVSLAAGGDVKLKSATDASSMKSSGGGSQYGVGVGFGMGGSQNGFSISLSASQNSANANGSSVTHHNSEVTAGNNLSVSSGQDVVLQGANLSGKHVGVDAGRNLIIRSEQDNASFKSQQSSSGASFSICVPPICAGSVVEGSANMSGSNLYNDFASVQQQSGIVAGEGGYDIYVGNHTQLDGAVIGSAASANKNHLSTGTLGWTDIDNHANSGGNGYGFSVSASAGNTDSSDKDKQQQTDTSKGNVKDDDKEPTSNRNSLPVATLQQSKDSASSTTYSAVSPGTIEIRNPDAQKQDVSQLSRDTASAENALKDKFDAEKLQSNLDVQREMTVLGQQVIETSYEKLKEQRKQEARTALENDPSFKGKTDPEKKKAIADSDKKVEAQYGVGSLNQSAAQAVVGLLSALAGGNVSGSVAAGASPLVAQLVKYASDNSAGGEPMRVLLHTLVSGLIAKAQGGSVAGGAAGGFTAAMLGHNDALSEFIFGKNVNELSEDQKELLANIGTLAGAVSGGAVDGSMGAGSGAVTGRTETENNSLSDLTSATASGKTPQQVAKERVDELNEKYKQENCAGMSAEACSVKMYTQRREEFKEILLTGADFVPVIGDIKSIVEAKSALDYLAAAIGIIPGAGDVAGKALKAAEIALKKGDVAEASSLLNKASDEISGYLPATGTISRPASGVGASAEFSVSKAQLGKKLGKHVEDFGGDASNAHDRQRVIDIINDIGKNPDKVIPGKFAGQGTGPGASRGDVFFRIKGNDVVVTKPDGSFVTILKDGVNENTSVINALKGDAR